MPISPEQRGLYPKDWKAISLRIRAQAGQRCQCVGECDLDHDGRCDELNRTPARSFRGRVVLTVAHLNHVPMDVREANLRAMCQRCHFAYDAVHHAQTHARNRTRKLEEAQRAAAG